MKHVRNVGKRTAASVAKANILRALVDSDRGSLANKSSLGYAAFPDYSFKAPQGAAFAVARLVRELEDDGLVRWVSESAPCRRYGYQITSKGLDIAKSESSVSSSDQSASRVLGVTPAGDDHQVISIAGGNRKAYRRQPCSDCPWRVDATGVFPADAFKASARTAYDMSQHVFACHQSGAQKPATCAGFLLRGADHNMSVRLALMRGDLNPTNVTDGGHDLHSSYRAMAVANGVSPDDVVLRPCRESYEELRQQALDQPRKNRKP